MIVTFGVTNCKARGLLIESVELDGDFYYFKYQNQTLVSHCMQVQNIIRASNVKRSKKIAVDISEFIHHYYDVARKVVWFDGVKLDSSGQQIQKILGKRINIDTGTKKRIFTMNDKKGMKEAAKKQAFDTRNAIAEEAFQKERAKRIAQLVAIRKQTVAAAAAGASNDLEFE